MNNYAIQKKTTGTVEAVCNRVTEAIKIAGFGVLTRIDFDKKIKEKTNQDLKPTVILGACNPFLAYEAYQQSTDVSLFIPCNIVVREIEEGQVLVEALRPLQMLNFLKDVKASDMMKAAEQSLEKAILSI